MTQAETDLQRLLRGLKPRLLPQRLVFVALGQEAPHVVDSLQPVCTMVEEEGVSAIISVETAEAHQLSLGPVMRQITLEVYSSLEAVGLTAAFAHELASHGISANVVAGYHHDHVFVPEGRAEEALARLRALSER